MWRAIASMLAYRVGEQVVAVRRVEVRGLAHTYAPRLRRLCGIICTILTEVVPRTMIAGKRVVLVDDFIVRGTTSVKIVQMIREAGAKRGAYPRREPDDLSPGLSTASIRLIPTSCWPTSMPTSMRWLTHRRGFAGLPVDRRALSCRRRKPRAIRYRPQFTDHYFTGDYPTRLLDQESAGNVRKLAVMASNG